MERGLLGSGERGVKQKSNMKTGYLNVIASVGRSVAAHRNVTVVTSINQGIGNLSDVSSKIEVENPSKGVDGANLELNSASTGNAKTTTHSFPTGSEAHVIHSPANANEEKINDAGTKVGPTLTGNTPGMSSYANVTGVPSRKALNFRTLFTPAGNRVNVVVSVESISAISERFSNTAYGFFLGKRVAYPVFANYFSSIDGLDAVLEDGPCEDCLIVIATKLGTSLMLDSYTSDMWIQSWCKSSYARALIEVRADVELKDNIAVAMPKLVGEGFYTCTDECPKNIDSDMVKNIKKPSQAPRGVPIGPKVGFKPVKQVYRPVSKNNNINTSGNKKKEAEPIIEVSNSNLFDVLNSVENDVDWVQMVGLQIWLVKRPILVDPFTLVDDEGKPLANVDSSDGHDSEDEVALVDNETSNFMASKKVGYGANSLLEKWKETYENDDYDFDSYD
ncbi:hypothetical protein Tco_1288584 [Tanacetum coccineum]